MLNLLLRFAVLISGHDITCYITRYMILYHTEKYFMQLIIIRQDL